MTVDESNKNMVLVSVLFGSFILINSNRHLELSLVINKWFQRFESSSGNEEYNDKTLVKRRFLTPEEILTSVLSLYSSFPDEDARRGVETLESLVNKISARESSKCLLLLLQYLATQASLRFTLIAESCSSCWYCNHQNGYL